MTALMYRKARQSHYFIFLMPEKNCNREFHIFGFTGQLSREEPDGFYSQVTMPRALFSHKIGLLIFKKLNPSLINTNPQAEVHNFTVRCRCFNVDKNKASYCLTQRPLYDSD